jgi:chromosome segregation ATPase
MLFITTLKEIFPDQLFQQSLLSTLPDAFNKMLQGANGQVVSLDDALKNLQAYGNQDEKFISDLKVLLTQLQLSLDLLKTTDQNLVELNDQYKKNIGIFLQIINSVDHEDSALKATASKVSSQVTILTKDNAQLTTDIDVEKGLSAQLEVEKQTLASLGTDLSAFVTQFNQSLVEKGEQLIKLQKELDQEKQTNESLKSEIDQLQSALPKIVEERRLLALDQQKLEQAQAELAAKLAEAHAA